jgi:hypothetical protein
MIIDTTTVNLIAKIVIEATIEIHAILVTHPRIIIVDNHIVNLLLSPLLVEPLRILNTIIEIVLLLA